MSSSAAKELSKINALGDAVPNVARIEVPKAVAIGLMGIDGAGQWGSFIGTNTENVVSWTAPDPLGDTTAIIGSFRQALSEVP